MRLTLLMSVLLTDFVGFSAYATMTQYPESGDVIALPGVVTNAGGAYNPDTSTFTCPTSAYYYIYFSLYVLMRDYDYNACHIDITMDDSRIVEVRHRDKYYDGKQFFRIVSLGCTDIKCYTQVCGIQNG